MATSGFEREASPRPLETKACFLDTRLPRAGDFRRRTLAWQFHDLPDGSVESKRRRFSAAEDVRTLPFFVCLELAGCVFVFWRHIIVEGTSQGRDVLLM